MNLDEAPLITRGWWIAGHIVLKTSMEWGLRLRVRGHENIPSSGAVLLVSNHISQVDPVVVGVAALPRRTYFMAKTELFRIPVLNYMVHRMGAFPVERGGADRRAMRLARELLARGDLLLMFPEGTRYTDGRLRPGLSGAGALALDPSVTVIPAAVWGSHRLLRRVHVAFGPPVEMTDLRGTGSRKERARDAVDRMMAAIAAQIPVAGGPVTAPPGHVDG
jgi:1-acyl-sn-glycerol-3-phosphate acyltransferase